MASAPLREAAAYIEREVALALGAAERLPLLRDTVLHYAREHCRYRLELVFDDDNRLTLTLPDLPVSGGELRELVREMPAFYMRLLTDEARRRVDRRAAQSFYGIDYGRGDVTAVTSSAAGADDTITVESIREAMRALDRNAGMACCPPPERPTFRGIPIEQLDLSPSQLAMFEARYWRPATPEVGTEQARKRGLELLKRWLSPAQRAQFEKEGQFEVTGGHTKKRYRIRHGRQMNIDELDAEGNKVCGWCFLPQGQLVAGDVMLAQKIALETDEREALKVANRFGGGTIDRAPGEVNVRPGTRYVGEVIYGGRRGGRAWLAGEWDMPVRREDRLVVADPTS